MFLSGKDYIFFKVSIFLGLLIALKDAFGFYFNFGLLRLMELGKLGCPTIAFRL